MFKINKILIGTHNDGKFKEISSLLPEKVEKVSPKNLGIESPIENGKTFIENSEIKADFFCKKSNLITLSDDSGLEIDCLHGDPGIFSARWAKKYGGWYEAMKKIYTMSREKKNTSREFSAKYYCVLTILWRNGIINCFTGEIKGVILWPPRGSKGFGYDPFFKPVSSDITFGEMDKSIKMTRDHRSVAFDKIIQKHLKKN